MRIEPGPTLLKALLTLLRDNGKEIVNTLHETYDTCDAVTHQVYSFENIERYFVLTGSKKNGRWG